MHVPCTVTVTSPLNPTPIKAQSTLHPRSSSHPSQVLSTLFPNGIFQQSHPVTMGLDPPSLRPECAVQGDFHLAEALVHFFFSFQSLFPVGNTLRHAERGRWTRPPTAARMPPKPECWTSMTLDTWVPPGTLSICWASTTQRQAPRTRRAILFG